MGMRDLPDMYTQSLTENHECTCYNMVKCLQATQCFSCDLYYFSCEVNDSENFIITRFFSYVGIWCNHSMPLPSSDITGCV